jgi:hypothetical protein
MPTDLRSNGKAGLFENILPGVTILQWFKRFDATLGLKPSRPPLDYSKQLIATRAFA